MSQHYYVVEVAGYEGEYGTIEVRREDGRIDPRARQPVIYCVAHMDPDGVLRIVDWGYPTAAEAEKYWPEAVAPNKSVFWTDTD